MSLTYDAIVVGGGVIGCSIAYQLSKKKKKVLLLEKGKVGEKASSAAAGMLGAQMEFEVDDPLYPLAKKSRQMFRDLAHELYEITGIDIQLMKRGIYELAFTEVECERHQQRAERDTRQGEMVSWLSSRQLREQEPSISSKARGALYFPNDGQVSPVQLTTAYLRGATYYGTEVKEQTEVVQLIKTGNKVTGVETDSETFFADHVILAGGVWSSRLLPELQMVPVKGECISFVTNEPLLYGTVKYNGCYLVPKRNNRIFVGATSVPHSFDEKVTFAGIFDLMERAKQMVPGLTEAAFEKAWTGLRPQTQNGKPYIGQHPEHEGLLVATGHYRNGILLSTITGKMITDQIESEVPFYET
ncbi:glycine oxidase ThiO [Fictibacillus phosphorivorans]|uniref:glycine oxidase ThiO n=1 Tax=Fictibacillus phosphorivorans TaxID=1221500 RepID=UPI00203BA17A|nr:glycine oxidase ThiO [Fictibacillus phosphorivorans]MCM3718332.1 glycine oxidase ThiO [Fictibacillus phosphorivorans]MCM3775956.1 glycine oxidase ThiO [Fictibacillus phosphorivorans]